MKKLYIVFVIFTSLYFSTNTFAQAASITWPLTSSISPDSPTGNIQGSNELIGVGPSPTMSILAYNNGQRLWVGTTGWIAGSIDFTRYVQFDATPTAGNNFTVSNVSFKYSDNPVPTDFFVLKFQAYYSLDNWNTKIVLNNTAMDYLNTTVSTFTQSLSVTVANGQTFSLRIYPYSPTGSIAATPSFAIHDSVIINGRTSSITALKCITPPDSMVGWWPGDGNANDISGNNNNGTLQGGANYGSGKVANALKVSNVADYVAVPNSSSLNFGTGNFSIDAWVKTNDTLNALVIASKLVITVVPNVVNSGFMFAIESGKLGFYMGDGSASSLHAVSTELIADGAWHFVAVTVDRKNPTGGKLYIDGNLVLTFDPTTKPNSISNTVLLVLAKPNISPAINEFVDEIEIFNRVLLDTEISSIFAADSAGKCKPTAPLGCVTPPSEMVAWWPLDETSGLTSIDLAGFNNSGTHVNAPVPVTAKVLGGLLFDGINDYVEVPDQAELSFGTGDFSFDAWIQTTDSAGAKDLVDKRTSSTGYIGYSFFINDGKLSLQMADGSFTNYVSPVFVADGKWHHIAVTVSRADSKGILFYLDGVDTQFGDPTLRPGSLNNKGPLRIGSQSFSANYLFKGILDEIELFNRVLTKTEIISIFAANSAGKCKPAIQDSCTGTKTWSPLGTGINNGTNGEVWALAVMGTDLYAGGLFTSAGNISANHIAKWDGTNWSPLGNGLNGGVYALAVIGSDLYAGGWFTIADVNTPVVNIAKWDGTSWSALGAGLPGSAAVEALAVIGNTLYAGGGFTIALGGPADLIAQWDVTNSTWSALGSNGGMDNRVNSLTVNGTDLYAGGQFTMAGGVPVNHIAKWDGTSWSPLGAPTDGTDLRVGGSLVEMAGNLFAGGVFTSAGGNSANHIAKWDGANWSNLSSGMNNEVEGLAVIGTDLYASGGFTTAGGVSANRVAKWDGTSWSPLGSGMNNGVWRLAVIGQDLYAGGIFTTAGGVTANYIAKYSCSITTFIDEDKSGNSIPKSFQLQQNYPNPFNPSSIIRYDIPRTSFVKISVYDILGREVRVLVNEEKGPGQYNVVFNAKNLASGVYFYAIRTADFNQIKKMILMK